MAIFTSSPGTKLSGRTIATPDGTLKFQRRLISGSFGTVYEAEYTKTCRRVAVKVIPRSVQLADRSVKEFQIQEVVQGHENIAHTIALYSDVHLGRHVLHGSFTGDLLVFDLYHNDLFTAITSYQYAAQEDQIRDTFLQVLSAVEYCHEHGVSHRDIKPENILCSEDGRHVFLTDFGFATSKEMVRRRCGSPMYMSWECSTHRTGDPATFSAKASDVWSLGMILLTLVTGHCAWPSISHHDYTLYRADPDQYWKERFPISPDLRVLLNEVFVQEAQERITLKELRKRVVDMPSFYLAKEELADALPAAKYVWALYAERGRIQREGGMTFKPLGSNDAHHHMPPSPKHLLRHARKVLPFIRAPRGGRAQL